MAMRGGVKGEPHARSRASLIPHSTRFPRTRSRIPPILIVPTFIMETSFQYLHRVGGVLLVASGQSLDESIEDADHRCPLHPHPGHLSHADALLCVLSPNDAILTLS